MLDTARVPSPGADVRGREGWSVAPRCAGRGLSLWPADLSARVTTRGGATASKAGAVAAMFARSVALLARPPAARLIGWGFVVLTALSSAGGQALVTLRVSTVTSWDG